MLPCRVAIMLLLTEEHLITYNGCKLQHEHLGVRMQGMVEGPVGRAHLRDSRNRESPLFR